MQKKNLWLLLFIYIAATAISYGVFHFMGKSAIANTQNQTDQTADEEAETDTENQVLAVDPKEAKDQVCPLDGKMFTKTEKDAWEKRRPLAVMIENHPDARPQSGLSKADVVFEALAEGGVTRFMGVFYCDVQKDDTKLAPIRSARTYYIDWASGFNLPLYVHVGGANVEGPANALGQLGDYGWAGQNDLNQFSIPYPTFVRDYNRLGTKEIATEHTMVTSTEKLWTYAADKRGWTNLTPTRIVGKKTVGGEDWKADYTPWSFQDGKANPSSQQKIAFNFWDGFDTYGVRWEYDPSTNSYKRFLANEPHLDLNSNQQIAVKNAVILFTDEKGPIDDHKHMLYRTTGTGDAWIFQNGQMIQGKWFKKDREDQLTFKDDKGKDLQFVRGEIWISVLNKGTKVSY
jgi:hypothetical protein